MFKNDYKRFFVSQYSSMVYAFLCLSLLLIYNNHFNVWGYLTNDDSGIQAVLSGLFTGRPFRVHQYIHFFLSYIVSFLYMIFPRVQWWFAYSLAIQSIGIFLSTYAVFEFCRKKNIPRLIALFLIGLLYSLLYIYTTANIAFTTVPAVFAGGIYAFFLMHILTDEREELLRNNVKYFVLSVIGVFICSIHRQEVGMVFVPFLLLAWGLYYCLVTMIFNKKLILLFALEVLTLMLVVISLSITNGIFTRNFNGNDFVAFNKERIRFTDYPNDSYDDNPELYQSIGWSREFAKTSWYFADDRVTVDAFRCITKNSRNTFRSNIMKSASELISFFSENIPDNSIFIFHILLLAVIITLGYEHKSSLYLKLFLCFINIGAFLLLLYLSIKGRLVSRAAYTIELPLIIGEIMVLLSLTDKIKINERLLLVIFLIILYLFPYVINAIKIDDRAKEESHRRAKDVYNYAIEHKDTVFVYYGGLLLDLTVGDTYIYNKPTNIISAGGSDWHSKYSIMCAEINGMKSEFNTSMFKDNKYHMIFPDVLNSGDDHIGFINMYRYIEHDYGAIGFYISRISDRLYDVSFVFKDNKPKGKYYTVDRKREIVLRNE